MSVADYEKLGAFYLGREHDLATDTTSDAPLLYDSRDLTTHGVIVGMTGSGKTGLAIGLLEEALIDGIPVIAIDPKGDLGNLLLTFPKLRAADFEPWMDAGEAARAGRTPAEHAKATAELWKKGLASWGQGPERIERLEAAAERVIYTPGSEAGRPLSLLRSLAAPAAGSLDAEALRDRVSGAVSGLLGLVGIQADPIRSREHVLLSQLVTRAWDEGRSLDLESLIMAIQKPRIDRVGVLDLESFYPESERIELAMAFNNLLASPGFESWRDGEPLDIGKLLYTADGGPRCSVLSIAHLPEAERMFVVTLVLNELVAWMRAQPGSRSLRALLYMDEVFGYFPPTANPPSKTPMLTLLKQARAYGLGVVLATQNPVDLDYKGLSNAGTWFLGRLQTERDKLRVIEGLEGAAATSGARFDRAEMEQVLAGLGSRKFLMNNVHDDAPVVFETRWVMSYLAGPMTREQIRALTPKADAARPAASSPSDSAAAAVAVAAPPAAAAEEPTRPLLPSGIEEAFLPLTRLPTAEQKVVYRAGLLAGGTLHFANARLEVDEWRSAALIAPIPEGSTTPWSDATLLEAPPELDDAPVAGARFADLPKSATKKTSYTRWTKQAGSHLYREVTLTVLKSKDPKAHSKIGEDEAAFRGRLRAMVREERDAELDTLRRRYGPKLERLKDRIERAEQTVDVQTEQYENRRNSSVISIGATLVGALFGRKSSTVGRAATAARSMSSAAKEKGDIARAQERVEALEEQLPRPRGPIPGRPRRTRGRRRRSPRIDRNHRPTPQVRPRTHPRPPHLDPPPRLGGRTLHFHFAHYCEQTTLDVEGNQPRAFQGCPAASAHPADRRLADTELDRDPSQGDREWQQRCDADRAGADDLPPATRAADLGRLQAREARGDRDRSTDCGRRIEDFVTRQRRRRGRRARFGRIARRETGLEEPIQAAACRTQVRIEERERAPRALERKGSARAHQRRVAAPPVLGQRLAAGQPGANRIEVHITQQLPDIGVGRCRAGPETALEQVAEAIVTLIEAPRITGIDPTHRLGDRDGPTSDQEMRVIGDEGPGEHAGA